MHASMMTLSFVHALTPKLILRNGLPDITMPLKYERWSFVYWHKQFKVTFLVCYCFNVIISLLLLFYLLLIFILERLNIVLHAFCRILKAKEKVLKKN